MAMAYKFARLIVLLLVHLFARLEVRGSENLPRTGGYIAVANHVGRLEVAITYYVLDRPDIIMLLAEKYKKNPLARLLAGPLDVVWVDRYNADFGALRETLNRLKKGGVLAIAPEGTRSTTGALIEGKPGASYLATKSGVPIVPAAATGTRDRDVLANLRHFKRANVVVTIGQPFYLPPVKGPDRDQVLKEYTDEIMCRIAALLPSDYRGVYVDYPRVQELLQTPPTQPPAPTS
jgi:1-acyl-sn-glycerol-3-phosphate acyltransferase